MTRRRRVHLVHEQRVVRHPGLAEGILNSQEGCSGMPSDRLHDLAVWPGDGSVGLIAQVNGVCERENTTSAPRDSASSASVCRLAA